MPSERPTSGSGYWFYPTPDEAREAFLEILDAQVFEDFPEVRRMIGNHGDKVERVRPTNYDFAPFLLEIFDDVEVKAWVIADWDGWRRDLVPTVVKPGERRGKVSDRTASRTFHASTVWTGWKWVARGLVWYAEGIGFVVNPWLNGMDAPAVDNFYSDQSLTANYCLNCDGFGGKAEGPYYPQDDFYYDGKDLD